MFLLDRSKTTLGDLRRISQASREASLDQELLFFEENLEIILADKGNFLRDLHRRLKQARSTYNSWNRRTAGGSRATDFVSVQQIEELVDWELINQKRKVKREIDFTTMYHDRQPVDMLIRFLQAFKDSQQLLDTFKAKISRPLFEFFNDDPKSPLVKALSRVLWCWECLLVPGPINHRLFSPKSAEVLYNMDAKLSASDSQFNLILRLIPDLALKAFEAYCLAKQWRSKIGPWGYVRELKYIQKRWIPEKRVSFDLSTAIAQRRTFELASAQDKLENLKERMRESETELVESSVDMDETEKNAGMLTYRYKDAHKRIDNMRKDFKEVTAQRSRLAKELSKKKDYIIMLQDEMSREQKDVQSIRGQLIQADVQAKYSKEKEMTQLLEDDLEESVHRCTHLRKVISKEENEYKEQMAKYHLTSERLNSVRTRIDTAKSEQITLGTRLSKSREQHRQHEKSFIAATDNFHLLQEELRTNKLTKQVLLRQMLHPKQPERPKINRPLIYS